MNLLNIVPEIQIRKNMSDLWNVLGYYEMGEEAQAKGDYFNAAKYFRLCYFYFEYGELPIYIEEISIKGGEAYQRYEELCEKLTAEELIEIKEKNKRIGFETGDIDLNIENFDNTFYNWSKSRFDEI